jgi:hypothetical protein
VVISREMSYSVAEIRELSARIGRSRSCLRRWASEGCDLRSHASVQSWLERNKLRETNVTKSRRRRGGGVGQEASSRGTHACHKAIEPLGNGETLGPIGRRGAAAALERLEMQEERAHARLEAALARGDSTAIDMAQRFWLQCSETLRRLDLCVETVRRESEAQVSVREARNAVLYASEWMRIAIAQFLSAEVTSLVAIKDPGEFKAYFFSRFKGVLDLTIKGADRTCSPLPSWAKESLELAWNVRVDP